MHRICHSILKISDRVSEAIAHHKPIVALQSTIISHGMPYPQNKQCALSIQKKVSQQGAVPATVAIFDGKIHVGLDQNQIQRLAYAGSKVRKVSRRDLPYIIANKGIGATTVSGTMIAAYAAGIEMFVTGGIGGVHRGFQNTMDVSADLDELARTPVAVVSAGVKSILDIQRTLEYLQTKGVPVMTYKSKYFPAFFSASSGLLSPFVVQNQKQAASILYAHGQLGLQNGVLIAVPNKNPAQGQQIQNAIKKAIKQSQQQNIKGASITPFLLKRVNQLTKGASLKSNISLVHNNAQVGARIAVELATLKKQTRDRLKNISINVGTNNTNPNNPFPQQTNNNNTNNNITPKGKLIAIGGSAIDYQIKPKMGNFQLYKSCIGKTRRSLGGVARNIVDCSNKLGIDTILICALGNDVQSQTIKQYCNRMNIQLIHITPQPSQQPNSSAKYYAILDNKNNQILGISQMQINQILTFQNIYNRYLKYIKKTDTNTNNNGKQQLYTITKDDIVVIDSNIPEQELRSLTRYIAQNVGCMIVFECKGQKTKRLITSGAYPYISLLKMNYLQSKQIQKAIINQNNNIQHIDIDEWILNNVGNRNPYRSQIKTITTNGPDSITILKSTPNTQTHNKAQKYKIKTLQPKKIEKTTGAGDTFTATYCSMLLMGKSSQQALRYALVASKINIQSTVNQSVISDYINIDNLHRAVNQEFSNK